MNKILELINKELDKVRPFLEGHGGDISIASFDEQTGCLELRFSGACVGCPMSQLTYEKLVHNQLDSIKEIKEIKLVS